MSPDLSVIVASHDRPLRLRWLLNALEEQTLPRERWEVVVCHDSAGEETEKLLRAHPLAADGTLRWRRFPAGSAAASPKRNAAAALARAPTLVFTDDDTRPPPQWLQTVARAVAEHPGAVIQGAMAPAPDEAVNLRAPFPRTVAFDDVPRVWAESCNIVYPAALVRALGGFAEDLRVGEDTDLCLRAQAAGAAYVGDRRMLNYHCVQAGGAVSRIRQAGRWEDLAPLVARQPSLRDALYLRVFWKREHAWLLLATAGLGLARFHKAAAAAGLPWVLARNDHGPGLRGRLRQLAALPVWAVTDAAELAVLARSSARHRTLVL